jgi:thioredoxin-dependent peroxiredoxin
MLMETSTAPDFTLPNQNGDSVRLSDYRGSWLLLYFYPQDDTPGCTTEACGFRDNMPFYEDLKISVLGISKDSPDSHKSFREKYNLPFDLLSDTYGSVSEDYYSGVGSTPTRISYLINPEGVIVKAYDTVDPVDHAKIVLADLKSLQ